MLAIALGLMLSSGCQSGDADQLKTVPSKIDTACAVDPAYADYLPAKVTFLALTELTIAAGESGPGRITAYVVLQDSSGSSVKAPGVLRFELFEYASRIGRMQGKRLAIWDDYDLTDFEVNRRHWRDFMRAYHFDLDIESMEASKYILVLTYIPPKAGRLEAQITLPSK